MRGEREALSDARRRYLTNWSDGAPVEGWAEKAAHPTVRQLAQYVLHLEREMAQAHEELDILQVQTTSFAGPFGDIKYEDRVINLAGRIKCLGAQRV